MTATGVVSTQSFYVESETGYGGYRKRHIFRKDGPLQLHSQQRSGLLDGGKLYHQGRGHTSYTLSEPYNHATTFRHSYWSEQYERAVHYDMRIDPGMTVDGSIGITETYPIAVFSLCGLLPGI